MKTQIKDRIQKYHEKGQHMEIIDLINSSDELDYDAYTLRARAWNNLGEPQKALEDLFAVEEEGKDDPLWNYRVMFAYDMMDENEKMIFYAERALGYSDMLDEDISLAMAYNYIEDEAYEKAIELMNRYKLDKNIYWNNQMGRAYYQMEQYIEASMYLEQALKLATEEEDEDFAESIATGLYYCYEKLGKTEAMKKLDEAFEISKNRVAIYSQEDMERIEDHIQKYFGAVDSVFHEIVSDQIHLDIAISPPTPQRNHYVLTTMGMGAKIMDDMPSELIEEGFGRSELMIALPPDWQIQSQEEKWYWPIQWLKILARLPFMQETWLGWGHTIPKGEPFAENTKLECMFLTLPHQYGEESYMTTLANGEPVHFLQLIPIYKEEMNYKIACGATALEELFGEDFSMVLDVKRKNYAPQEMKNKFYNWKNSPFKQ